MPVPVHILTMSCPDRPGIVASMSQGLLELDANIIDNAQHSDPASGLFCMRTRFDAPFEHALNIDFVNESLGPGARVAVELSAEAARALVATISAVLERADAGGYLEQPAPAAQ